MGGPSASRVGDESVPALARGETELPPEAASVSAARRWVRVTLREWQLDDVSELAELLVSELASNAVLHARTPFRVRAELGSDRVTVGVQDSSSSLPHAKHLSVGAATGRGLGLVAALAREHGAHPTAEGKVVWFSLDRPLHAREDGVYDWAAVLDETGAPSSEVEAAHATDRSAAADLLTVRLLGFPVRVNVHASEHHDDLTREFTLLALDPDTGEDRRELPARFLELIDGLGRRYQSLGAEVDAVRDAALARGALVVDLQYAVPRGVREPCIELAAMLDLADDYCRSEHLLTLQTPEIDRRFREWFLGEFVAQIDGEAPTPWAGPLQ